MRKGTAGFSLIEFAISNLATMIMLGATFTLLNSIFTANAGMGEVMQTQQNLRVAMNTITRDITMAGTGVAYRRNRGAERRRLRHFDDTGLGRDAHHTE